MLANMYTTSVYITTADRGKFYTNWAVLLLKAKCFHKYFVDSDMRFCGKLKVVRLNIPFRDVL